MNETSKLAQFRDFLALLKMVTNKLGTTITPAVRNNFSINRSWEAKVGFPNTKVDIELTYTHYDSRQAALYIGEGSKQKAITNLSAANLKKHIAAKLVARQHEVAGIAEEIARENAASKAEDQMAETLTVQLKLDGFTKLANDDDYHIWRSSSLGTIKLAYVDARKNDTGSGFTFIYNVEYNFTVSGVSIRGELDTENLSGILRSLKALYTL